MTTTNSQPMGMAAATDLGMGGDSLGQQLKDETDDERKKRMALAAQNKALGPAALALGLGGYGG